MKANVGGWDRNLRWIAGAGAIIAGLAAPVPRRWRWGLFIAGAANLLTAATGYCPANKALGFNTRPTAVARSARFAAKAVAELLGR